MSRYRLIISTCLALSVSFPSAAATVFWPFGFHFPDSSRHYAGGGLIAAGPPARPAAAFDAPIGSARDLQIALLTDSEPKRTYDVADLDDAEAVGSSVADDPAGGEYFGN